MLVQHNFAYPALAAGTLALCSLGDTFLYAYLPVNYQSIGLSTFWVGLILSANRFTRIFLNGLAAHWINTTGIRFMTLVATLLATACTLAYGFAVSGILWVAVRVLWGAAFSTLRLSSLLYALQADKKGLSIGLSKSVIALGPILALLIGPLLIQDFSRAIAFSILGVISLCGFFVALLLPEMPLKPKSKIELFPAFPSSLNQLVFLSAFVAEGMLVVHLGLLISDGVTIHPEVLLLWVGSYLAYRRICMVLFSPFAGWLADRFGFEKTFKWTFFFLIIGLAFISADLYIAGILIAFTFSAMNASVSPGSAVSSSESMIKELSDNATWRDLGAATGTLIGSVLFDFLYLQLIYLFAFMLLGLGLILHLLNSKKN